MVTFGELAHMVDATQLLCISAIGHMVDATQLLCISVIAHMVDATQLLCCASPPLHTWSMLRNLEELEKLL